MSYSSKKPPRSRRTPQNIQNVALGSGSTRSGRGTGRASSRNTSSKQPSYSNAKKTARARKGVVEQVMPETLSGESASEHAKRVKRPHYTVSLRRHANVKSILIAVVVTVAVLILAGSAGAFVFVNSVTDKMSLHDEATTAALVTAEEGSPSYTLFVGEFYEPGQEYVGPSLLILARFDEASGRVSLISIPSNTQVKLSNGETGRISAAQTLGGDAELIKEVSELAKVSISHIVKIDREGFVDLVDGFGGLTIDVTEEIDDPHAGSMYIPVGQQTLDGEEALTLCRATNLSGGETARAENQCSVGIALAKHLLGLSGFNLYFTLDGIAENIKTDYKFGDLTALIGSYSEISEENIFTARVPGYSSKSEETGIKYYIVDNTTWESMLSLMKSGENPADAVPEVSLVDPASFTITVRNGSGVTGGARQVADSLASFGYQILDVGNADQYVYETTLVIYNTPDMADAAESVVVQLGIGRSAAANGLYAFESDILIVVGKDWKPLS